MMLAASLLAAPAAAAPGFDPAAVYAVPLGDAPSRGPADAAVTIVLWSDFACQYCAALEATVERVDRLYPGQLRWVYRHLPLDARNTLAAEASVAAAAQGRFWPMRDRLMAVRGQVDRIAVESLARDLGLDLGRLRGDLDAGAGRAAIAADVDTARALGISGTPTAFVNGRALAGNQPTAAYVRVIDEELARAGGRSYAEITAGGVARAAEPDADRGNPADDLDLYAPVSIGLGLPGHQDGPDDALVTIAMWTDAECGYCRASMPVIARLRRELPDDVRIIYRHLPLARHRAAGLAAEALAYAGSVGKLVPMLDRLMTAEHLTRADLEVAGAAVGLDRDGLADALDTHRFHEAIAADAAAGAALGIDGTPTFFVNGMPLPGAVTWERLRPLVDGNLVQARALVASGIERRDVYAIIAGTAARADRADPSRLPQAGALAIEPGPAAREGAAVAACRLRDAAGATRHASRLIGSAATRLRLVCAGLGVDLP